VGSATIGTDHVDQDYLASRHIAFANAAGCSKHSVAQYVITAILTLRPDYWQRPIKLGIIGLGNIGSTLAQYAQDLGWQVLGYDPLIPPSMMNNVSFEQVLT
ncbi:NAD(P)-dependent oxidoreductase, partial [Klebsiella michiganensis]|uniref:NAD(P)-dependent oxidoreductase n=1 Tax=Klebsiella michiganensis TaxID=1134687 RepID=UPI00273D9513